MRSCAFIAVLAVSLWLAGCAPASIYTAQLDQPFTIYLKQIAQIGELQIRFIGVSEDSRCPIDVTCVWAGNAQIKLGVSVQDSEETVITLNSNQEPTEALYEEFRIKFVGLRPAPQSTRPINPGEYRVTLVVSKLP